MVSKSLRGIIGLRRSARLCQHRDDLSWQLPARPDKRNAVRPGRVNEPQPSDSRWRRVYVAVSIYAVVLIALLYGFSRYFGG
jgi:type VI protein secretion system component VasF